MRNHWSGVVHEGPKPFVNEYRGGWYVWRQHPTHTEYVADIHGPNFNWATGHLHTFPTKEAAEKWMAEHGYV